MPSSRSPEHSVLVLGAGPAGARHARNLAALGARVAVADVDPERAASIAGADSASLGLEAGPVDLVAAVHYDGVVVATPTSLHREHALAALAGDAAVLVEKPLASSGDGLDALVAAAGDRVTVGYNLRLHRPVERLRDLVAGGAVGKVTGLRLWFGSWLPDWRPGTDYRRCYSARADLGGGILLDASHEIDLLVWLAGPEWEVEEAVVARRSDLEIDVEDTVQARLRSPDGVEAHLDLDCVSRDYRRGVEVTGERGVVRLDWALGTLGLETVEETGHEPVECMEAVAESYRREAAAFLSMVEGTAGPVVPASEAAVTVRLCERIRERAGWDGP